MSVINEIPRRARQTIKVDRKKAKGLRVGGPIHRHGGDVGSPPDQAAWYDSFWLNADEWSSHLGNVVDIRKVGDCVEIVYDGPEWKPPYDGCPREIVENARSKAWEVLRKPRRDFENLGGVCAGTSVAEATYEGRIIQEAIDNWKRGK